MINRMFPKQLTNEYKGLKIAKWVFILITIVTLGRSLVHMFARDGGAQSIANIPLDRFSQNGAATAILIFSLWGLSQLLIGLVYTIVLWRYQALIPFMYLLIVIEYVMRIVLSMLKPIVVMGTAPGAVGNYIFVPIAIGMLVLSLRQKG